MICLSVRIPARQRKHDFNDETVSVLHFEDPPQNTVEKLRRLDDNYLHGSLLPLDRLEEMGIRDGDLVSLYDLEFEYQH